MNLAYGIGINLKKNLQKGLFELIRPLVQLNIKAIQEREF